MSNGRGSILTQEKAYQCGFELMGHTMIWLIYSPSYGLSKMLKNDEKKKSVQKFHWEKCSESCRTYYKHSIGQCEIVLESTIGSKVAEFAFSWPLISAMNWCRDMAILPSDRFEKRLRVGASHDGLACLLAEIWLVKNAGKGDLERKKRRKILHFEAPFRFISPVCPSKSHKSHMSQQVPLSPSKSRMSQQVPLSPESPSKSR